MNSTSFDALFPTWQDILRVLFRHKFKVMAFFVTTMALMVVGVMICPRQYISQGQLFVKVGRETVGLDPTATTGSTISMLDSRQSEINSVAEMLRSRELIEHVVDVVGTDAVLESRKPKEPKTETPASESGVTAKLNELVGTGMAFLADIGLADPVSRREKAIIELSERLDIRAGKKSSVIDLEIRARSPEEAKLMLDELLVAYNDQHLRVNRTSGSYKFFTEQAERIRCELDDARESVRQAKSEMGLVSVRGQQLLLEDEIRKIELDRFDVTSEISAADSKIGEIEELVKTLPVLSVTEELDGNPNNATDGMRQTLYQLEVRLKELLAKNTEDHPSVQIAREQLREAQEIFGSQTNERTQRRRGLHSGRQKLEEELLLAKAKSAGLKAKQTALNQQLADLQLRSRELNENEQQLAKLELEAERLESNYRAYWQSREQANIDQLLEQEQISNVNISQAPSLMPKPVSPPKMMVGLMALMFATSGGLALAFLCDYFDSSIKTPEEAERTLGLPVLVSLQKSSQNRFKPSERAAAV